MAARRTTGRPAPRKQPPIARAAVVAAAAPLHNSKKRKANSLFEMQQSKSEEPCHKAPGLSFSEPDEPRKSDSAVKTSSNKHDNMSSNNNTHNTTHNNTHNAKQANKSCESSFDISEGDKIKGLQPGFTVQRKTQYAREQSTHAQKAHRSVKNLIESACRGAKKTFPNSSWVLIAFADPSQRNFTLMPEQDAEPSMRGLKNMLSTGEIDGCTLRGNVASGNCGLVASRALLKDTPVAVEGGLIWPESRHRDAVVSSNPLLGLSSNFVPAQLFKRFATKRVWDTYSKQSRIKDDDLGRSRVGGIVIECSTHGNETRHIDDPGWLQGGQNGPPVEPNVDAYLILDLQEGRNMPTVGFFTTRAVKKGEELLMDWGCWNQISTTLLPGQVMMSLLAFHRKQKLLQMCKERKIGWKKTTRCETKASTGSKVEAKYFDQATLGTLENMLPKDLALGTDLLRRKLKILSNILEIDAGQHVESVPKKPRQSPCTPMKDFDYCAKASRLAVLGSELSERARQELQTCGEEMSSNPIHNLFELEDLSGRVQVLEITDANHPACLFSLPEEKTHGLFAKTSFNKGDPILCYGGELRDNERGDLQFDSYVYDLDLSPFGYEGPPLFIDGRRSAAGKMNDSRSIGDTKELVSNVLACLDWDNDSCTPQIVFVAETEIEEGDELLCDYGTSYWKVMWKSMMTCHAEYTAATEHDCEEIEKHLKKLLKVKSETSGMMLEAVKESSAETRKSITISTTAENVGAMSSLTAAMAQPTTRTEDVACAEQLRDVKATPSSPVAAEKPMTMQYVGDKPESCASSAIAPDVCASTACVPAKKNDGRTGRFIVEDEEDEENDLWLLRRREELKCKEKEMKENEAEKKAVPTTAKAATATQFSSPRRKQRRIKHKHPEQPTHEEAKKAVPTEGKETKQVSSPTRKQRERKHKLPEQPTQDAAKKAVPTEGKETKQVSSLRRKQCGMKHKLPEQPTHEAAKQAAPTEPKETAQKLPSRKQRGTKGNHLEQPIHRLLNASTQKGKSGRTTAPREPVSQSKKSKEMGTVQPKQRGNNTAEVGAQSKKDRVLSPTIRARIQSRIQAQAQQKRALTRQTKRAEAQARKEGSRMSPTKPESPTKKTRQTEEKVSPDQHSTEEHEEADKTEPRSDETDKTNSHETLEAGNIVDAPRGIAEVVGDDEPVPELMGGTGSEGPEPGHRVKRIIKRVAIDGVVPEAVEGSKGARKQPLGQNVKRDAVIDGRAATSLANKETNESRENDEASSDLDVEGVNVRTEEGISERRVNRRGSKGTDDGQGASVVTEEDSETVPFPRTADAFDAMEGISEWTAMESDRDLNVSSGQDIQRERETMDRIFEGEEILESDEWDTLVGFLEGHEIDETRNTGMAMAEDSEASEIMSISGFEEMLSEVRRDAGAAVYDMELEAAWVRGVLLGEETPQPNNLCRHVSNTAETETEDDEEEEAVAEIVATTTDS